MASLNKIDDYYVTFYAAIPAPVRYDERLGANEKLLYAEITAACGYDQQCPKDNGYFAKLYGVSEATIEKWFLTLAECGFISIQEDTIRPLAA